MNEIEGTPVVRFTAARFLDAAPDVNVIVAAPAFDTGGRLEDAFSDVISDRLAIFYGSSASPLQRMVDAVEFMADDDYIIRCDGLHFAADIPAAFAMRGQAIAGGLDCMKLPDDFPPQFGTDIYRVGALRAYAKMDIDPAFHVHPKYGMFADKRNFKCSFASAPRYSDDFLAEVRRMARSVYVIPRLEVNEKSISAGDQLSFHYEVASRYISSEQKVLDIACGGGYGSFYIGQFARQVMGADLDPGVVEGARRAAAHHPEAGHVEFSVQDVTATDFSDASFDAVLSMETVEHVDDDAYIREIARVLRPGGLFILSTPQNALGHIPVNAEHQREYSIEQIESLVQPYFDVKEIVGIKQGRIVIPGSPRGCNVMLICEQKAA